MGINLLDEKGRQIMKLSRNIFAFTPYAAVLTGMGLFSNGWIAILLYHLVMISVLFVSRDSELFQKIFRGWRWWGIPLCLGSIGGGVLIWVLWPVIQTMGGNLSNDLVRFHLHGTSWKIFVVYYGLFHPPLEQIFWRGYFGHPSRKIHWRDVAFAGYHFLTMAYFVQWPWAIISVCVLIFMAWFWRQVVRITGGLLIPILSHLFADISVIVAVTLLLKL